MLDRTEGRRRAALRRSLEEEWLYATDLPLCVGKEAAADFQRRAEQAGWQTKQAGNWILLDRETADMPEGGYAGPFGEEARSCLSLLNRHEPETADSGKIEKRMLIRAGEEGADAYEAACGRIHREWAARLREGRKLPDISKTFFTGGKEEC